MTSEEAKQALKEGKRVRHKDFPKYKYLREQAYIVDDQREVADLVLDAKIYQSDDWEIVE